MKKLTAVILTLSMLTASAASVVYADYNEHEYDIPMTTLTFDDGTVTNTIDGTKAVQAGDEKQRVLETDIDSMKEFYLGFDFCLDADTALIEIPKYKSNGDVDKVGPRIKCVDGELVTETGSKATEIQKLGAVTIGTWYSAEIEGRTDAGATFRLYDYSTGEKTLVQETLNFNTRRLSAEKKSFNGMGINNASIDNIVLVSEKPDTIVIETDADELNAGQALVVDYTMFRGETETTKYGVEWALYDESGENELTDGSAKLENSALIADISSATQTVTVKASSVMGEKTLIGEKKIKINSVDTADEKYDTIEIGGEDNVKAGESITFTVNTTKGGMPVEVSDEDVVWSLYDSANISEYENKNVKIENGVLTVADGTMAHKLTVRAGSKSGKVYGSKEVNIAFGDSQKEEVLFYNAFESGVAEDSKSKSIDGSTAYLVKAEENMWAKDNYSEYLLTEMDVKFTAEGAGFMLKRRDAAKVNTEIKYSSGNLKTNAKVVATGADTETWYHVELMYYVGVDASCNIYSYNEDGTLSEPITSLDLDRRNDTAYGTITFNAGTLVDNLKISRPMGDDIKIVSPGQYTFAGESKQYGATVTRNGLPIKGATGLIWSVLDAQRLPILDASVSVDANGLVEIDPMAQPQTVTVRVEAANGAFAESELTIQSTEIFEITNLGVNEEKTKVTRIYAKKNFAYNDEVTFMVAIYGKDGRLKASTIRTGFGDSYKIGDNEISVDFDLPSDFDSANDVIKAFVWTSL